MVIIYANAIHAEENDSRWKGRGGGRRIKMNQLIGRMSGNMQHLITFTAYLPNQRILKTITDH